MNLYVRNDEIKKLRKSGLTLQVIGDKFGISRERVRQILDINFKQRLVVAVLVKDGLVASYATNEHECKRVGYPTGVGYELCEGCQYHNHAEAKAVQGQQGGVLHLFGHFYACEPCKLACKERDIEIVL